MTDHASPLRFTAIMLAEWIPEIPDGFIAMNASRPLRGVDIECNLLGFTVAVNRTHAVTIEHNRQMDATIVQFVPQQTAVTAVFHALADEYGFAAVADLTDRELLIQGAQSVYASSGQPAHKVRVIG